MCKRYGNWDVDPNLTNLRKRKWKMEVRGESALAGGVGLFTSISCTKRRATAPDLVNTAVPFPYGLLFVIAIAASNVSTLSVQRTGPNISSVYLKHNQ